MQFVFDEDDLREILLSYLQRFDEEVKIDFTKSIFTFNNRAEHFTNLTQLALEFAPDD